MSRWVVGMMPSGRRYVVEDHGPLLFHWSGRGRNMSGDGYLRETFRDIRPLRTVKERQTAERWTRILYRVC